MNANSYCELLKLAKCGDQGAWAELDAHIRAELTRYAAHLVGTRWAHLSSQDLVQETLQLASQNISGFKGANSPENTESCFRAWLKTIMHHQFLKWTERKHISVIGLDPILGGAEPAGRDPSASTGLRAADMKNKVAAAMLKLDPQDRQLVVAVYFEGKTQAEVARSLGFDPQRVRDDVGRARRELAELLGDPP